MNFKLNFGIQAPKSKIGYSDNLFFVGSCFSENIAEYFTNHYFRVCSNPHGILFNPISISQSLNDVVEEKKYKEEDLFFEQGLWRSFQHHGKFSHPDKSTCLQQINTSIETAHAHLKNSQHLFITLGSAHAYKLVATDSIVANCHKLPQQKFEKVLLQKERIVEEFVKTIDLIRKLNPAIHIVFTVSPVRYIRDGVVENNLSKAILLQSVHEIVSTTSKCSYFPSYEIVIDELRDYRFFKEDMVHPNELAVKYIWERLQENYLEENCMDYIKDAGQYKRLLEHRVLNESERGKHEENIATAKKKIIEKYPEFAARV